VINKYYDLIDAPIEEIIILVKILNKNLVFNYLLGIGFSNRFECSYNIILGTYLI